MSWSKYLSRRPQLRHKDGPCWLVVACGPANTLGVWRDGMKPWAWEYVKTEELT